MLRFSKRDERYNISRSNHDRLSVVPSALKPKIVSK